MKNNIINKKSIIIILFVLIIFSNSYLLAKYTSVFSGFSNSSVAKWSVSYDTNDNDGDVLSLISGNSTKDYIIKVTSTSEVSANYSIILTNVPSEMEVKIDGGTYRLPINNTISFENVNSFGASDVNTTHTHRLIFNAPIDSNIASSTQVGINVIFNQID